MNINEKLESLIELLKSYQNDLAEYNSASCKAKMLGYPTLDYRIGAKASAGISRTKKRLAKLEETAKIARFTPLIETEINGVIIVDNLVLDRLQVFFPEKVNCETVSLLRRCGFKWSTTHNSWQHYRGPKGEMVARELAKDFKPNNKIEKLKES